MYEYHHEFFLDAIQKIIFECILLETRRPFSRMSTSRKALPMAAVSAVSLGGEPQSGQTTARVNSSPALATERTGENPDSQYEFWQLNCEFILLFRLIYYIME